MKLTKYLKRFKMPSIGKLETNALSTFDGTSITASHQTVTTVKGWVMILTITNNCNKDLVVSFDGGTTDHLFVPAKHDFVFDYSASHVRPYSPVYAVKHDGTAPTSGKIAFSVGQQEHRSVNPG